MSLSVGAVGHPDMPSGVPMALEGMPRTPVRYALAANAVTFIGIRSHGRLGIAE